jgi:hypothetical protein
VTDAPQSVESRPKPVPGVLTPGVPGPAPYIYDDHVLPRTLICLAGATTSGITGIIALVLLLLETSHQTGGIFLAAAGFAVFTAWAELITIASLTSDRRMVTWFAWSVTPGHVAGAAAGGYLIREAGMDAAVAGAGATLLALALAYFARRWALAIFESCDRKRRPGACPRCGYAMGELGRCPECGKRVAG